MYNQIYIRIYKKTCPRKLFYPHILAEMSLFAIPTEYLFLRKVLLTDVYLYHNIPSLTIYYFTISHFSMLRVL